MELAGVLVSAAAAVLAALAARAAFKSANSAAEIVQIEQERREEERLDRLRAYLLVFLEGDDDGNLYLVVQNEGPSHAWDVELHIDEQDLGRDRIYPDPRSMGTIRAKARRVFRIITTIDDRPPPYIGRLVWFDGSLANGYQEDVVIDSSGQPI